MESYPESFLPFFCLRCCKESCERIVSHVRLPQVQLNVLNCLQRRPRHAQNFQSSSCKSQHPINWLMEARHEDIDHKILQGGLDALEVENRESNDRLWFTMFELICTAALLSEVWCSGWIVLLHIHATVVPSGKTPQKMNIGFAAYMPKHSESHLCKLQYMYLTAGVFMPHHEGRICFWQMLETAHDCKLLKPHLKTEINTTRYRVLYTFPQPFSHSLFMHLSHSLSSLSPLSLKLSVVPP